MSQQELSSIYASSKWAPPFLREFEQLGTEVGFINAIHETLQRDNVTVDIDGDFEQLKEHSGGVLFVGDHKNSWEFVAAMDMVSQMGRDDMLNVAKFYVRNAVNQVLGQTAADLLLPVYPRILASDRQNIFNYELFNRLKYHKDLLTLAQSQAANDQATITASERLTNGGVVNVYPTGQVVDAGQHPWREGVGKILKSIPDHDKDSVLIVPYNMQHISRMRFMGAIAMRGKGIFGKPQSLNVQLGTMQTASELVGQLHPRDQDDPKAITALLQQQFIKDFTNTSN